MRTEKTIKKLNVRSVFNTPILLAPEILRQCADLVLSDEKMFSDDVEIIYNLDYLRMSGKTAIINVSGVLAYNMPDIICYFFGFSSVCRLKEVFLESVKNPDVEKIIFNFHSPGGYVVGIQDLADTIFSARGSKPIIAVVNESACSAAYWLAAACDEIWLNNESAVVGSVGVYSCHVDCSKALSMQGLAVTEIASSEYKTAGSDVAPLSDVGKAEILRDVLSIYGTFIMSLCRYRGWNNDFASKEIGDGRTWRGLEAAQKQFVLGIKKLEDCINMTVPVKPTISAETKADAPTSVTPVVSEKNVVSEPVAASPTAQTDLVGALSQPAATALLEKTVSASVRKFELSKKETKHVAFVGQKTETSPAQGVSSWVRDGMRKASNEKKGVRANAK